MIKKDFHGMLVEEALHEVEMIVGRVRNDRKSESAEFVTGNGIIRNNIFSLLQSYNLQPSTPPGNTGVITVIIE